jgi:CheY-like chemotaxis protein
MPQERTLIVEDEPDLRQVFVEILTTDGYDISTASDGEMAIQMLSENNYDLSLILDCCDLHLAAYACTMALVTTMVLVTTSVSSGRVRACLRSWHASQPTDHEVNHGHADHSFTGLR